MDALVAAAMTAGERAEMLRRTIEARPLNSEYMGVSTNWGSLFGVPF